MPQHPREVGTRPVGVRGRDFETEVASRLRASGYDVAGETLIGHKRVDLVARERRHNAEWVVAVEAKEWAKPLNAGQLQTIWRDYEPLYATGSVHELLIVSREGFTPAGRRYAHDRPGLVILALAEMTADDTQFKTYLQGLIRSFEGADDRVADYYQRPFDLGTGRDIEDLLTGWVHGDHAFVEEGRPVAILGAYGIGKSTFARRFACQLAKQALEEPDARVPVLIRLGEIAGEQDLEGLLGKHFTATNEVAGYSFRNFMNLNEAGRFVIILDGFDEMKQMLTWREFRHNLAQLNRLHHTDARLVLLGRPTAFENDEQQAQALHGIRQDKLTSSRDPGWPDYLEVELAPLKSEQIKQFLLDYLRVHQSPVDFEALWTQVSSKHLRDIARRPVQLRMLADILPAYTGDVLSLDIATVYEIFIDTLIERIMVREEEKQSRFAFSAQERRQFLGQLAYWLWTNQAGDTVETESIPEELVRPHLRDDNLEGTRRDLVVGCPLDRRAGERVRFPHRSFQEFLVAEELWQRLRSGTIDFLEVDALANDEVAGFMEQLRSTSGAVPIAAQQAAGGLLHWRMLNVLFIHDLPPTFLPRGPAGDITATSWRLLALAGAYQESAKERRGALLAELPALLPRLTDVQVLLSLFCSMSAPDTSPAGVLQSLEHIMNLGDIEKIKSEHVGVAGVFKFGRNVGDARGQNRRIGVATKGDIIFSKGTQEIAGTGASVEVRWYAPLALDVAERLSVTKNGRALDLRGLRGLFAAVLPAEAFVSEWLDRNALRSTVRLAEYVDLPGDSPLADRLNSLRGLRGAYSAQRDRWVRKRGRRQRSDGSHLPPM